MEKYPAILCPVSMATKSVLSVSGESAWWNTMHFDVVKKTYGILYKAKKNSNQLAKDISV